jgi:hypothetical protein
MRPVKGNNDFINHDGTQVLDIIGYKMVLQLEMKRVPSSVSQALAGIFSSGSFVVTCTAPMLVQTNFTCTSYSASCTNGDPRNSTLTDDSNMQWSINVTLESLDCTAVSGDSL